MTGSQLPPRADGGPVSYGKTYLVGERGPELFTPNVSGAIVPNHALGGGGNSTTVVLQVQAMDAASFDDFMARGGEDVVMKRIGRAVYRGAFG